jgi:MFS family permease
MAQTASSPVARRTGFYYGWVIVAVSMVINGLSGNVGTYFGLFVVPVQSELQWSRTTVVLAATIASLAGASVQPFIGPFLDRYGGRVMTVVAGVIAGVAVACAGLASEPWQLYLAYGVYGAASNGVGLQVTNVVVAKWFVARRGRALGFASIGLSASNLIMVPLLQVIISGSGWRFAFLVLGLIVGIGLAVPAALFLRRQPEDMGLRPDGAPAGEAGRAAGQVAGGAAVVDMEHSLTLREALRTRVFYQLLIAWMLAGIPVMAYFVHTIPYLTGDKGIAPALAASAWSVWFLCGSVSKLVWGFISERMPARFSMAACLFGEVAGIAMLLNVGQSLPLLFAWAVVGGTGHGPFAQFQTLIFANYYGRRFLGAIRGFIMPFIVVAGAAGPLLAAYLFQRNGNYQTVWLLFIAMLLVAGTLAIISRPPRRT